MCKILKLDRIWGASRVVDVVTLCVPTTPRSHPILTDILAVDPQSTTGRHQAGRRCIEVRKRPTGDGEKHAYP